MWRPKRMSTLKTKEESKVTQGEIQGSLKNRLLLLSDWARLEARHTKSSASCSPLSIFINKVLFEHSHLFPHHLGVAFVLHWRGRVLARKAVCAPKPGIFIIWSFIAQLCRFSSNQVRQEQKAAFSPFCLLLCLNLSENWHNADSPWKKKKKKAIVSHSYVHEMSLGPGRATQHPPKEWYERHQGWVSSLDLRAVLYCGCGGLFCASWEQA